MRILHVSKYYYPYVGGVENICKYLVESYPQYEVAVVCFNDKNEDFIDEVNGHKVYRVATQISIARQALSFSYFSMLRRAINEFQPDIIQFHWANPFPAAVLLTVIPKNMKLMVFWHMDIIKQKYIYPFIKPVEKRLLKRAQLITVTSPQYKEYSKPLQAFKDKVELGRVWFGALQKLSKHSSFEDAALAVLSSAKDLGYSVDKLNLIREAFEETKILNDYYVKGQVTDNDGKGLSNVSVTIINNDNPYLNYELLTDKSGNFEFRNIPLGDYSIAYEKAKYTKVENQLKISDDIDDIKVSLNKIKEKNYDAIDVVFVVDISASMTENDPSDFRKQILVNILSSMDLDSRASVVVFNKVGKVLNDGLSDSVVGKKVIMTDIYNIANDSGYQDNSGTNGKAGLQTALRLFDKDKKTRKYVIFFTDGKDTVSNKDDASYDELIKKAKKLDVRIITVGLGDDIESSMLIKLANETSGKYYIADFDTNLTGFDKKIFDEIQ